MAAPCPISPLSPSRISCWAALRQARRKVKRSEAQVLRPRCADRRCRAPQDAVSPDKKQKRRPSVCTGAPRGPPHADDLLTPAQLGGWLGFTESGLAKLRLDGGGPKFIKIRGAVRYRRRDVLLYLDQETVATTAELSVKREAKTQRKNPTSKSAE
jgi:hypothetical protein